MDIHWVTQLSAKFGILFNLTVAYAACAVIFLGIEAYKLWVATAGMRKSRRKLREG